MFGWEVAFIFWIRSSLGEFVFIFIWGCLQFLGEVFLIFWLLFRQSGEVWWCFLVLAIGTAPPTVSHKSLLDCPILPHNANCVFCQSTLLLAHLVPALSLGAVRSLLNFWTSKHRLILHRHPFNINGNIGNIVWGGECGMCRMIQNGSFLSFKKRRYGFLDIVRLNLMVALNSCFDSHEFSI